MNTSALQDKALRYGFGLFFLVWGVERMIRTEMWASQQMLGSFYGDLGAVSALVLAVAVAQIAIAASLFTNYKVRLASAVALLMVAASVVVTIVPLTTYLLTGENPLPAMLFIDHAPLVGGLVAVYLNASAQQKVQQPLHEVRLAKAA